MTEVERTVEFDAGPDEVWGALVDASLLSEWFDGEVDLDLQPGGALRVESAGCVREAVVDDVVTERRLAFTWSGDADQPPSTVELVLEPGDDGCTLRVREAIVGVPGPPSFPVGFQPPATARGGAALALAR
jgi:uncharacterized protein YndB with AHSA1/START domain